MSDIGSDNVKGGEILARTQTTFGWTPRGHHNDPIDKTDLHIWHLGLPYPLRLFYLRHAIPLNRQEGHCAHRRHGNPTNHSNGKGPHPWKRRAAVTSTADQHFSSSFP